ncbi:hypothetical protein HPB52_023292 [Rhipicephalus sanguineus]|uniref:Uncharacterized protein n=1 Tax=Rhipicephalus sanguineus TaxID=34632 RepID=A0A9D4TC14_RHISA|nr:hypothetical protein HPB52_023292 [Rhipicephalus sanguineus]
MVNPVQVCFKKPTSRPYTLCCPPRCDREREGDAVGCPALLHPGVARGLPPEVMPPRECVVRCLESWCLRIERPLPPDCEDTMPYIVGAARPATLLDACGESPLRTALPPTSLSRASPPLVECARAPSLAPSPPRAPRDQGAHGRARALLLSATASTRPRAGVMLRELVRAFGENGGRERDACEAEGVLNEGCSTRIERLPLVLTITYGCSVVSCSVTSTFYFPDTVAINTF